MYGGTRSHMRNQISNGNRRIHSGGSLPGSDGSGKNGVEIAWSYRIGKQPSRIGEVRRERGRHTMLSVDANVSKHRSEARLLQANVPQGVNT